MAMSFTALSLCLYSNMPVADGAIASDEDCETIEGVSASASLILDAEETDEPTWRSSVKLVIPESWPKSKDLLQDRESQRFQTAYSCLFGGLTTGEPISLTTGEAISVAVENKHIVIVHQQEESASDWDYEPFLYDWDVAVAKPDYRVHLRLQSDAAEHFSWSAVKVTAHGFSLSVPAPLPSKYDRKSVLDWQDLGERGGDSVVTFRATPSMQRQIQLYLESGNGYGQYLPFDIEGVILLAGLILLIRHRRRLMNDRADRDVWKGLQLLCAIALIGSLSEVYFDLYTQLVYSYNTVDLTRLVEALSLPILTILAFKGSGGWRFLLMCLLSCFSSSLILLSPELWLSALPVYLFSWLLLLHLSNLLFRSDLLVVRLIRVLAPISLLLGLLPGTYSDPETAYYFLTTAASLLIPIGLLWILAWTYGSRLMLPGRQDRLLLSLAVSYMFLTFGPYWYLGLYMSVISVIAFVSTYLVLSLSARNALLQGSLISKKALSPEDVVEIQENLIGAERRVTELKRDLRSFEGVALTKEQISLREALKTDLERLRQWPDGSQADTTATQNTVLWTPPQRYRRHLRRGALPAGADPIDVALALGPSSTSLGNFRSALRLSLLPALGLALFFVWKGHEYPFSVSEFIDPYLPVMMNVARELVFWLLPVMLLGITWPALYGRRGSSRALQIWLCISIPVLVHEMLNRVLSQDTSLLLVLHATLSLMLLLVVGFTLDLRAMRRQSRDETVFHQVYRYYRFNRILATATLILPLATAAFTLWNQIDNGVLNQQAPSQPAQDRDQNTVSPSPSPEPP